MAAGDHDVIMDGHRLRAGDTYHYLDPAGRFATFTVAGTTQQGWLVDAGAMLGDAGLAELLGDDRPPTRFYVDVEPSADAATVADELTNQGAEQGVDARTSSSPRPKRKPTPRRGSSPCSRPTSASAC